MSDPTTHNLWLLHAKSVYDTTKQAYIADGLLIMGETIISIGSFLDLHEQYPVARIVDYTKFYLLPGLINTHVHLEFEPVLNARERYIAENPYINFLRAAQNAQQMLLSGVTTLRDAGSSWRLLQLNMPDAWALAKMPRMQLAGPPITITGGHLHFLHGEADSYDEVIKAVRKRHKQGCTAIKIIVSGGQMTPGTLPERESYSVELIKAMTQQANQLGMPTFSHCLTTQGFVNSVLGGVQCIEHCACFVRNKKNGLLERVYEPEVMEQFRDAAPYFMSGISNNYHMFDRCRGNAAIQTPSEAFLLKQEECECEIFAKYIDLGMVPVVGTDAGCGQTYFNETFLECEIFVQRCGLSTADTIAAATINGAKCLGLGNVTGMLATGYSADIIALPKDPLQDITALRNVAHVVCKGRIIR